MYLTNANEPTANKRDNKHVISENLYSRVEYTMNRYI